MIYAVFGGEYSDWYVIGYFTDKKQAEAFCEECNERHGKWDSDLYVKELHNLSEHEEGEEKFGVCVSSETWIARWSYTGWETVVDYSDGTFDIYMKIFPSQMNRVVKIAQDRLAKWKAEKEGIT